MEQWDDGIDGEVRDEETVKEPRERRSKQVEEQNEKQQRVGGTKEEEQRAGTQEREGDEKETQLLFQVVRQGVALVENLYLFKNNLTDAVMPHVPLFFPPLPLAYVSPAVDKKLGHQLQGISPRAAPLSQQDPSGRLRDAFPAI